MKKKKRKQSVAELFISTYGDRFYKLIHFEN